MGLIGVYLGVAAVAVVGLVQTMRSQARSRAYLEAAIEDELGELDHLARALRALVVDARALRSTLDGPQRLLERAGPLGAMGADAEELDSQLREASRALGDWLAAVENLSEPDRERLEELSAHPRDLERLFREENFALERNVRRGQRPLGETLKRVRAHLVGVEQDLQKARDPYR